MKHLVIGLGEVGSAIQKVLNCEGLDLDKEAQKKADLIKPFEDGLYDFLHICIPYTEKFVHNVKVFQNRYNSFTEGRHLKPLVVVHSTVPLGTCDANGWVHSPVRGVHPHMEEGLRTFTKYFGGENANEAALEFNRVTKIQCISEDKAATTEALKLWDTTQYGVMIALEKEIHAYCKRHGLDFYTVYEHANRTYNEGYMKLGRDEVVRPYLRHIPGPIGGHCVIPNAEIIASQEVINNIPLVAHLLTRNIGLQHDAEQSAQDE